MVVSWTLCNGYIREMGILDDLMGFTMLLPSFESQRAKAILCHLVLFSLGVVVLVLVHILPLGSQVVDCIFHIAIC